MEHDVPMIARALARTDDGPWSVTRRRFLQLATGAAGGVLASGALPAWAQTAPAVADQVASEGAGVLVLVNLQGGNDALNTVAPLSSAAYTAHRGPLALPAASLLPLDGDVGLHPALTFLHDRWRAGQLAVVEGIGGVDPDLSHFTSMARWMSGRDDADPRSGWLGRFLDTVAVGSPFAGVALGSTVPLTLVGEHTVACAIGDVGGAFGTSTDPNDVRLARAVQDLAAGSRGRGALADAIAASASAMVAVNAQAAPIYEGTLPDERPARDLVLAARLLNARMGVRVVNVDVPGFDTHATQLGHHADLLGRVDRGLAAFFATLDPRLAGQVTVAVASEFGRALTANDSTGTDHGTAGVAFLVGSAVRGGRHGQSPSLDGRARFAPLPVAVDQRALFATLLTRWLGADDTEILGASIASLDVFATGPTDGPGTTSTPPPWSVADAGRIEPLRPVRVLDTRTGTGGIGRAVGGGETITVSVGGVAVPASATGVVLNLTVTEPTAPGYVTLWPSGQDRPLASNVNFAPGQTVPNLAVTALGPDGAVCLYNSAGAAHLVVDVVASIGPAPGATLVPIDPFRLLDTRDTATPLRADVVRRVRVAGEGSVPAHAVGVVANITVTEPTAAGYVTVWPAGQERPTASNLNMVAGQTVPNLTVARLADGAVDVLLSAGAAHLVIDIVGALVDAGSGARLHTTTPTRVLDTREAFGARGRLVPMEVIELTVAGAAGVPLDAVAVALNVTAVDPTAFGWLTVWPVGQPQPTTSSLNLAPRRDVANLVITRLGRDGAIAIANARGDTDVVADVVGWFA